MFYFMCLFRMHNVLPPSRPSSSSIGLADLIGSQLFSLCSAQLCSVCLWNWSVSETLTVRKPIRNASKPKEHTGLYENQAHLILYYTIYTYYIYILYTYDNYQLQLQLRVLNSPTRSKLFSSFKNIFYGFKICVGHKTQKSKYINNEAIINFRIYAPIFAIGCLSLNMHLYHK